MVAGSPLKRFSSGLVIVQLEAKERSSNEAVGAQWTRTVHDVEVKVRCVGVAGVAEQADHLALFDLFTITR